MRIDHLFIGRDALAAELAQLRDEGRDVSPVEDQFVRWLELDDDALAGSQAELAALLEHNQHLPCVAGYPYEEPSDLESIRAARPDPAVVLKQAPSREQMRDRLRGAWLGRISGCLLGKPVEGWDRARMHGYLRDTGRWPLQDYFTSDVPADIARRYRVDRNKAFVDRIDRMVWDDDINYTVLALLLLERRGVDFTMEDVARNWLEHLPVLTTWTAERTAYRNFLAGVGPPESARTWNPYREWIGAQIRGDAFGWFCPGRPELAAELAWRDAAVSHVKNGLYGAMWVAAMLAAAPCVDSPELAIRAGLEQIPAKCRLAEELREVLGWAGDGVDYDGAVDMVHGRYDESFGHHWCHTVPNAMLVAVGLLWGEAEFGRTICRAVQGCFDTDCNGATAGSVAGIMSGSDAVDGRWTAPLNGEVETGIAGMNLVRIDELAVRSAELLDKLWSENK